MKPKWFVAAALTAAFALPALGGVAHAGNQELRHIAALLVTQAHGEAIEKRAAVRSDAIARTQAVRAAERDAAREQAGTDRDARLPHERHPAHVQEAS